MYVISQAPAAAALTVTNGAATQAFTVIAGEPGAGTQDNLNLAGSNRLNGQPFTVRAAGSVTYPAGTYTASTIQILLCAANTASFAVATANAVASMTALTAATTAFTAAQVTNWEVEFTGLGINGGQLAGVFQGFEGTGASATTEIAVARAVATNPITTVNLASEPPAQFAVAVVSGGAQGATIVANLTQLVLEA